MRLVTQIKAEDAHKVPPLLEIPYLVLPRLVAWGFVPQNPAPLLWLGYNRSSTRLGTFSHSRNEIRIESMDRPLASVVVTLAHELCHWAVGPRRAEGWHGHSFQEAQRQAALALGVDITPALARNRKGEWYGIHPRTGHRAMYGPSAYLRKKLLESGQW